MRGKVFTWVWTVASVALSAVVLGFLAVGATWIVGVHRDDEDLTYHGLTSLLLLAVHRLW
jgi:hypothetical protein